LLHGDVFAFLLLAGPDFGGWTSPLKPQATNFHQAPKFSLVNHVINLWRIIFCIMDLARPNTAHVNLSPATKFLFSFFAEAVVELLDLVMSITTSGQVQDQRRN
jgi:hypothetical protein